MAGDADHAREVMRVRALGRARIDAGERIMSQEPVDFAPTDDSRELDEQSLQSWGGELGRAAIEALADYDGGDLVTIEGDNERVRIWIDNNQDQ